MIEEAIDSCFQNYWRQVVDSVYDSDTAAAERFKPVWRDFHLGVYCGQRGWRIDPFIRGYGKIQNPDPSLFELVDPLPAGKPIFGPTLMNSPEILDGTSLGPKAWGLVPTEGNLLYKIGWDRSQCWYMVAGADGQHAFFQQKSGAPCPPPHVVIGVQYAELPAESREKVIALLGKNP